jgi:transcriptional regulator with XRE-family HTH domain
MKERIRKFMDYKSITAVELADNIGVQRSNISHILNGRNKPGAAFLEKFLLAYPLINARWLLTGEGEMISAEADRKSTAEQPPAKEVSPDETTHRQIGPPQSQPTVETRPTAESKPVAESRLTTESKPSAESRSPMESGRRPVEAGTGHPETDRQQMQTDRRQMEFNWGQMETDPQQMELKSEPEIPYGKKAPYNPYGKKYPGRRIERVILLHGDGTFQSYESE